MQGSNIWNMITTYYITSPVWLVLSIAAIIYIVLRFDRGVRKKILLCVLFAVLLILNEVSYHLLTRIFDQAVYYRFLWVVPYGMIVAYALMQCILDCIDRKNQRQGMLFGGLLIVGVMFLLCMTQGNYFDRLKNDFPQNKYLVADDILEMKAILDQERAFGVLMDEPVIACPKNVMLEYQTVDAGCVISTNRNIYLMFRERGVDVRKFSQSNQDGYLLSTICEDNAQPDVMEAKAAILREEIDYIVVHANAGMEAYMESLDCGLVGVTQSYLIYRYDYPYYEKVTNKQSITQIKDTLGVHEDEIILDLGLEQEYVILALNDVHAFLMDDTVTEANRQAVQERYYGMFLNATGIHSVDMWNGLSTILDSYEADGMVLIGDMIDYSSQTNASAFAAGLENIETPYIYLRADHDLGVWYTEGGLSGEDAEGISSDIATWQDVYVVDYDDFYLVGWNNSTSQLSVEGLDQIKAILDEAKRKHKQIILATHVPLNSTVDYGLEQASRNADSQGRAKLWGEGCLYQPNETTQEFLDMVLAEDSPVVAVIAGHLHFKYTVPLNENITEYVLDKSFDGNIGVIRVR